jgi:hypothetical protein
VKIWHYTFGLSPPSPLPPTSILFLGGEFSQLGDSFWEIMQKIIILLKD